MSQDRLRLVVLPHEYNCSNSSIEILPDPSCPYPGYWMELAIAIIHILSHRYIKIQPVFANTYSMTSDNDSSVVGKIFRGEADISLPNIVYYPERMEVVKYLEPIFQSFLSLAFRRNHDRPELKMKLEDLYPGYILAWAAFLVVIYYPLKWIIRMQSASLEDRSRWTARTTFTIFFFYGLLVSLMRSRVTIAYNSAVNKVTPFEKSGDLLKQLESGKYRLVYVSQVHMDRVFNQTESNSSSSLRFTQTMKKYPPTHEPNGDRHLEFLLNPSVNKGKDFVSAAADVTHYHLRSECDVEFYLDKDFNLGFSSMIVRYGLEKHLRIKRNEAKVITAESKRLVEKYYGPIQCTDHLEPGRASDTPLTPSQVQGAFFTLLILSGIAVIIFAVEYLYSLAKAKRCCFKAKP